MAGDYVKFKNDSGLPVIGVGFKEFKCIGGNPPMTIHKSATPRETAISGTASTATRNTSTVLIWADTNPNLPATSLRMMRGAEMAHDFEFF